MGKSDNKCESFLFDMEVEFIKNIHTKKYYRIGKFWDKYFTQIVTNKFSQKFGLK